MRMHFRLKFSTFQASLADAHIHEFLRHLRDDLRKNGIMWEFFPKEGGGDSSHSHIIFATARPNSGGQIGIRLKVKVVKIPT